jgi:hypothetical protein
LHPPVDGEVDLVEGIGAKDQRLLVRGKRVGRVVVVDADVIRRLELNQALPGDLWIVFGVPERRVVAGEAVVGMLARGTLAAEMPFNDPRPRRNCVSVSLVVALALTVGYVIEAPVIPLLYLIRNTRRYTLFFCF